MLSSGAHGRAGIDPLRDATLHDGAHGNAGGHGGAGGDGAALTHGGDATPNPRALVGRRIVKKFGRKAYDGVVLSARNSDEGPLWLAFYPADGDREELSWKELCRVLQPEAHTAAPAGGGQQQQQRQSAEVAATGADEGERWYKGVRAQSATTWAVHINLPGANKASYVGAFDDRVEAARVYDAAARALGIKSVNFPSLPGEVQARPKVPYKVQPPAVSQQQAKEGRVKQEAQQPKPAAAKGKVKKEGVAHGQALPAPRRPRAATACAMPPARKPHLKASATEAKPAALVAAARKRRREPHASAAHADETKLAPAAKLPRALQSPAAAPPLAARASASADASEQHSREVPGPGAMVVASPQLAVVAAAQHLQQQQWQAAATSEEDIAALYAFLRGISPPLCLPDAAVVRGSGLTLAKLDAISAAHVAAAHSGMLLQSSADALGIRMPADRLLFMAAALERVRRGAPARANMLLGMF
jgi:hypothetical protein